MWVTQYLHDSVWRNQSMSLYKKRHCKHCGNQTIIDHPKTDQFEPMYVCLKDIWKPMNQAWRSLPTRPETCKSFTRERHNHEQDKKAWIIKHKMLGDF